MASPLFTVASPDSAAGAWPDVRRVPPWLALLAIAVVATAAYWPALYGGMLWDDDAHVTRADLRSWHGLCRIWVAVVGPELPTASPDDPRWAQGATQQYYPLLHSAFWVQWHLWGDSPFGYHLANLLLHLAATVLVYAVLRKLRIPGALLAAAIFALHPVQVETVAWITEQKNTLSAVFYLGAALAYLNFDDRRRASWYILALLLFVLGLFSKTVTATLPAALLVVFWWSRSRDPEVLEGRRGAISWRRDLRPLMPFFVLGAAMGLFTAWMEHNVIAAIGNDFTLTLADRVVLAGRVVWFYLGKLIWPADLMFFYPRWEIDAADWRQWLYPAAVVATLIALWAVRKKTRAPLAAALFFVGTLFPVLGFFNVYPFKFSYVADHFQYLASLGIITLFAAALTSGLDRLSRRAQDAVFALCTLLVGLLALLTRAQTAMYISPTTLYETTIQQNPDCWLAYHNLGAERLKANDLPGALALFEKVLEIKPDFWGGHLMMGGALLNANRREEATKHLLRVVELKPRSAPAYVALGKALLDAGQIPEAIRTLEQALKLNPEDSEGHNNLGIALRASGKIDQAIEHYDEALRLKPDYAAAHNNLAIALLKTGKLPEAVDHFQQAVDSDPDFAEGHSNLAGVLLQLGKPEQSLAHLNEVLRQQPENAQAWANRASAHAQLDQVDEAVGAAEKALTLARAHDQTQLATQLEAWLPMLRGAQATPTERAPNEAAQPEK